MATTSLGRLTLDLAINLMGFTDGMNRAERETAERTRNMQESVTSFREHLARELGGTQIGDIIDGFNERFGSIEGNITKLSAALGGMAIGGAVVATGALARMAIETAQADKELYILANRANTSVKNFQVLEKASAQFGVTQDQLGSILADVQEKLGEFSATEGGGAADFFEALQNNTSLTTDEIRELGKAVQGKDGVEAIQLLKDKMDELGATSQEQRFVFESLASDLGNLLPLFDQGGAKLADYEEALDKAGVVKTEEAIQNSIIFSNQIQDLKTKFEGLHTQLVADSIPAFSVLISYFTKGATEGDKFGGSVSKLGGITRSVAVGIVGISAAVGILVTTMQQFGQQIANIGSTAYNFFQADGLMAKGKALADGMTNSMTIGLKGLYDIGTEYQSMQQHIKAIINGVTMPGASHNTLFGDDVLAGIKENNEGLAVNTKQADENAKANEKAAKAKDKHAKAIEKYNAVSVNSRVLEQAAKHNYAGIEKKYGLPQGVLAALSMQESRGNPNAVSPVGAKGAFQFMPGTAKRFGIAGQETNVAKSAEAAAKYLNYLIKMFGSIEVALAGYNAGEGNVKKYGGKIPPFKETKKYVPAVMSYLSFMQGKEITKGSSTVSVSGLLESEQKALEEQQRAAEQLAKEQQSIRDRYYNEREKAEATHRNNLAEIDAKFGEGTKEALELRVKEELRYEEEKKKRYYSLRAEFANEEERLERKYQDKIQEIKNNYAENSPEYAILMDELDVLHREELKRIRYQDGEKFRQAQKHIGDIRNLIESSLQSAQDKAMDIYNRGSMHPDDYARLGLNREHQSALTAAGNAFNETQEKINQRDEYGDYIHQNEERSKLLQEAKRALEAEMYAIDVEYADKRKKLEEDIQVARLDMYAGTTSAMSGLLGAFFGENKRIQAAMFAIEKGYTLAGIWLKNKKALSEAWASAPFPYNLPAVATTAMETGALAAAAGAITPVITGGIAHGGLDYVPKESTYLLDKGERVLSPKQNQDLTKFMQGGNDSNVNITINVDAQGNSTMDAQNANQMSRQLANTIKAVVVDTLHKERRQGGILYG